MDKSTVCLDRWPGTGLNSREAEARPFRGLWRRAFWRPRVGEIVCISDNEDASIRLSREFLNGDVERHITLKVQWPPWLPECHRTISVRFGVPQEVDTPRSENSAGGGGERARRAATEGECSVEQVAQGWLAWVRIRLPRLPEGFSGPVFIDVCDKARGDRWTRLELRVLDGIQTRALLLSHLRLDFSCLWAQNGSGWNPGSLVPASTPFLVADFRLAGTWISKLSQRPCEEMEIDLVSGGQVTQLERREVALNGRPVTYRSQPIPVRDSTLLRPLGIHTLRLRVAGQEIANLRFRILTEAELLRYVRVSEVQIDAEMRDGQIVPGLKTLRWEEHQAFWPSLLLEAGVPACNSLAKCIVRTLQGTKVLRHEEFVVPLDKPSRRVKLQRMELGTSGLQARPKPARLVVSVCIGGEVKGSTPVLVLPPERITNFEGQLTFEAEDLPFDQTEYEQIVHRLGLPAEPITKGGWWNWIKSLRPRFNTGNATSRTDPGTTETSETNDVP